MLTFDDVARRRIDAEAALRLVEDAVGAGQPFSFVRQNDGEAVILGARRDVPDEDVMHFLHHWWKKPTIDWDLVEDVRDGLLESARGADLLGFFDSGDPNRGRYKRTGVFLRKYDGIHPGTRLTSPELHYEWQRSGQFARLLNDRAHVTIVSNYDLLDGIARHFRIGTVAWIPVPGHARYTDPRRQAYQHYPDRFAEMKRSLRLAKPGTLVLVGAGVLGKMYCHWLKQAGCIALDIGSVFDFWANNQGRRSVRSGATRQGF